MSYLDAVLGGAKSGATGLVGLPLLLGEPFTPEGQYSPFDRYSQMFPTAPEPTDPGERAAYLAAQGAVPGMLGGPAVALMSGLTNAGIGTLTQDPTARAVLGLVGAPMAGLSKLHRARTGPNKELIISPTTGTPVTRGQMFGKEQDLRTEAWLRQHPQGAPYAQQLDKTQADSMANFFAGMQAFSKNPKLSPTQLRDGTHSAYNAYWNSLVGKYRSTNNKNFQAAKDAGSTAQIPLNNTIGTLQKMIGNMDASVEGNAERIKYFTSVIDDMAKKPSVNIDVLQQHLANWGTAAYKGVHRDPTRNVSIGVDSYQVRQVLDAIRTDLSAAIKVGTPGAKELAKARDEMTQNSKALSAFADIPLSKYFSKPLNTLTPEDVVTKLAGLSGTERTHLMGVLGKTNPGLADATRYNAFTALTKSAEVPSAAYGVPSTNVATLLDKFGSLDKEDVAYLFPSSKEQQAFNAALTDLRRINRTSYGGGGDTARQVGQKTAQEVAGAAAGAPGKYGTQTLQHVWETFTGLPAEKQAAMLFSPEGRTAVHALSKGSPGRLQQFFEKTGIVMTSVGAGGVSGIMEQEPTAQSLKGLPAEYFGGGETLNLRQLPDDYFK